MDDVQKRQLLEDLQFAFVQVEKLRVLDPKAPMNSKKNPMEIKSLLDVFALFGYSADDIIDHHDQCSLFHKIRRELEDLLRDLSTKNKKYDKAVLIRDRLRTMKQQFIEMQGNYETRRQENEQTQFNRATMLASSQNASLWQKRTTHNEGAIDDKMRDLLHTHQVERDQLEGFLQRIPQPHVKFSRLLLDLKTTEGNLSRLGLYEDAKNVFVKADAIEKDERMLNAVRFEQFKDNKRKLLVERQQSEVAQMEEKLMEKRYILMRASDNHRKTEIQRVKNLRKDMGHCHKMDLHDKQAFSISSEVPHRQGYGATAASFRGQQFLSTVQGKRLEVNSLCKIHDDENGQIPPDSVVYSDN